MNLYSGRRYHRGEYRLIIQAPRSLLLRGSPALLKSTYPDNAKGQPNFNLKPTSSSIHPVQEERLTAMQARTMQCPRRPLGLPSQTRFFTARYDLDSADSHNPKDSHMPQWLECRSHRLTTQTSARLACGIVFSQPSSSAAISALPLVCSMLITPTYLTFSCKRGLVSRGYNTNKYAAGAFNLLVPKSKKLPPRV